MNYFQKERLTSYDKVLTECDNAPETVAIIPLFAKNIARLRVITSTVKQLALEQGQVTTGITTQKNNLLDEVIGLALDVAGAVHAYAEEKNDTALQEKMDYSSSDFSHIDQSIILTTLEIILVQAQKLSVAELEECGITAAEMTDFVEKLAKLKTSVNEKGLAVIDQSNATKQIGELMTEAANLKKKSLDRLARQFERKAPDFYFKYKASSSITYKSYKKSDTTADTKPAI